MVLQPGQRITAPFPPAPAEVKNFQPRTGYFLPVVVLDDDHHTYKPLRITDDQLAQIQMQGNLRRAGETLASVTSSNCWNRHDARLRGK